MAGEFDPGLWASENASRFPGREAGDVAAVLALWREQASEATGADAIAAASAQRHLTARGTGLPTNFALVVTPTEVVATKFNPRNQYHPIEVVAKQFGKRVGAWPRGSVSVSGLEAVKLATGLALAIDGADPVPCRTPRLPGNPAAAAVIALLGGDLGPE